ncbi:MAG: molybdopterin-binding protein [Acidobacteriota bacterium]
MSQMTAAILVIGDEILSGKTEETNARFLISELRALGVALRRILIVPDDIDEIATAISDLSARFTYVFTSGGVGPTHDDVTLLGISKAFDRPIYRHPELEAMLRNYFGDKITEAHLHMADVPTGSTLITAPDLRWPLLACNNVYILPGVPEFFCQKFQAIKERFRAAQFHLKCIYTQEDEFSIAYPLEQVARDHPLVAIGSYPAFDGRDYRVKVTIESKDAESVEAAFQALHGLLNCEMIVRFE